MNWIPGFQPIRTSRGYLEFQILSKESKRRTSPFYSIAPVRHYLHHDSAKYRSSVSFSFRVNSEPDDQKVKHAGDRKPHVGICRRVIQTAVATLRPVKEGWCSYSSFNNVTESLYCTQNILTVSRQLTRTPRIHVHIKIVNSNSDHPPFPRQ